MATNTDLARDHKVARATIQRWKRDDEWDKDVADVKQIVSTKIKNEVGEDIFSQLSIVLTLNTGVKFTRE